jgi:hypothetical protein
LEGPSGNPRTDRRIEASIQWAERIMPKIDDRSGDTARAKSAYQDFFALWKDANPDIPVLKEAKAEYEKLSGFTR